MQNSKPTLKEIQNPNQNLRSDSDSESDEGPCEMTVPAQKLPSLLAWNWTGWFTYPTKSIEFEIFGWYGISVGLGHSGVTDSDFVALLTPPRVRLLFADGVEWNCWDRTHDCLALEVNEDLMEFDSDLARNCISCLLFREDLGFMKSLLDDIRVRRAL